MEKDNEKKVMTEGQAAGQYPGIAIDVADKEKVTSELVKERIKEQNDNPRNEYPIDD